MGKLILQMIHNVFSFLNLLKFLDAIKHPTLGKLTVLFDDDDD